MKNLICTFILGLFALVAFAMPPSVKPVFQADNPTFTVDQVQPVISQTTQYKLISIPEADRICTAGVGSFVLSNWAELLLGLLALVKVIVRLTPSLKDDKVFGYLDDFVNLIIQNNESKNNTDPPDNVSTTATT
jgi:hypothetical protein